MKKISMLLMLTMFFVTKNFAQSSTTTTTSGSSSAVATRGLELSIGAEGALPIGSFKDKSKYQFGLGGSAKLAIPLANNLDATISAGYIAFSRSKINEVRNRNTFTTIPFKGGLRVRMSGFYFEPQLGITQTKISNQEGGGSGVFTYAANIGFLVARAVDLSVRYEALGATKVQDIQGTGTGDVSAKMIGILAAFNIPFARVH